MKRVVLVFIAVVLFSTSNLFAATKEDLLLQEDAFAKVASGIGPSVVSIAVVQMSVYGGKRYYYPYRNWDPYLDEFLKEFFESPREYKQSGLGSGVIIDERGYILTNEHVVSDADEIEVILSDGRKIKGTVKGSDPRSDLAVVKIEADDLPVAVLGDSDKVRIGQWVMAVGNPFGFLMSNPQPTITVGVVSALHRSFSYRGMYAHRYYGDLIQTDAAINRGNSGGPLVNLRGEVIGINALIYSTTGGYQGIGFAIPINRAKRILDELIAGREVKYGWLGVQVQSLSPELVELFDFPVSQGALVAEVIKDSPADIGGLKKGDLICKIDNKEVNTSSDLVNTVSHLDVDQKVMITACRKDKEITIPIIIGQRPKEESVIIRKEASKVKKGWRGIEIKNSDKGIVVLKVTPGSSGFIAGIREDDIIDEVNREEVKDVESFDKIVKVLKGEVLIHTNRGYFVVKGEE